MNSRQRVLEAINHREPDRVPIDVCGTKATGMNAFQYIKTAEYAGIDVLPPKVFDQFQMLARPKDKMLGWLHADVIEVENLVESWHYRNENWQSWHPHGRYELMVPGDFNPIKKESGEYELVNDKGETFAVMAKDGFYFDRTFSIDMAIEIVHADLEKFKQGLFRYTDEELKYIQKQAEYLHNNTEYSVHGGFMKGKMGSSTVFAGHSFTDWLCILMLEPEYAKELLDISSDIALENLKMYLQAAGKYIDTIFISNTDFGSQKAEMFSADIWKDVYMPNYKKLGSYVHENSDIKTMFHSCGSIRNIIPHIIEAEMDILNPVQANTEGMNPAELKREFGDDIVFWGGGIDTQDVLPFGTKDDVSNQVKQRIEDMGENGGFVFAAVHNIQADVPAENMEAMIEAVLTYGNYTK